MSAVAVAFIAVTLTCIVDAADDVCYPEVGCFSMSYPWVTRYRPAHKPLPPDRLHLRLDFYSREHSDGLLGVDLTRTPMYPSRPTVIIAHGHEDDGNALWMRSLKDAYLQEFDANVVLMDWASGAIGFQYEQSAANIRVIGRVMAMRLQKSINKHGLFPQDFHLIGEGLGAHLMGYISKELIGMGRITGLDPSRELFEFSDIQTRLDKSDANFVDVVHTSSRLLIPNTGIGLTQPIGHVDFYVNIGEHQPGCEPVRSDDADDLILLNWSDSTKSDECNHRKAREYFIQSVWRLDNCTFWGHKRNAQRIFNIVLADPNRGSSGSQVTSILCTPLTCTPLGLNTADRPARGTFFIRTRRTSPYCIHERIVPLPRPKNLLRGLVGSIASTLSSLSPPVKIF